MADPIDAGTAGAPAPAPGGAGVEDLRALAAEARNVDQAEQLQQQQAVVTQEQAEQRRQQQQQQTEAMEVVGLLSVVRDLGGAMAEDAGYLAPGRTRAIWTDEALTRIAGPLVVIMHRHGGSLSEWMQQWGPYMALVAAAAMPVGATLREVREQRAARAKASEADQAGPTPAPQPGAAT